MEAEYEPGEDLEGAAMVEASAYPSDPIADPERDGEAAGAAYRLGRYEYDDGFGEGGFGEGGALALAAAEGERPSYFRDPDAGAFGLEAGPDEASATETGAFATPGMLYDEESDDRARGAAPYGADDEVDIVDEPALATPMSAPAAHRSQNVSDPYADSVARGDDHAESYGAVAPSRAAFDVEARKAILVRIMPFESGSEGYSRVEADGEFAGRFGADHPAYRKYHLGLTFGAFPFVQENGTLARVLEAMRTRDRAAFDQVFGPGSAEMVEMTRASGAPASQSADGLSARLQRRDNAYLWEEPWLSRFRAAGRIPLFQGAQNEVASGLWIEPMLGFARGFGLTTARALLVCVDRAVQMGTAGAKRWIAAAVNPIQTPAQIQQALAALNHADVTACQRALGLPPSGEWDPDTQAGLVGALRAAGRSPVPLPLAVQMIESLVRRAAGTPWEARMARLAAASVPDVDYTR